MSEDGRHHLTADGVNGQISIIGNKFRISRKRFLAFMSQGMKGDKEILISQISSVQFKKAGVLTNGYIQVSFMGGTEAQRGLSQASGDENTVIFSARQQSAFERIKEHIDSFRDAPHEPSRSSTDIDDLERLAALKDRGIITESEFEAKKRQILGL